MNAEKELHDAKIQLQQEALTVSFKQRADVPGLSREKVDELITHTVDEVFKRNHDHYRAAIFHHLHRHDIAKFVKMMHTKLIDQQVQLKLRGLYKSETEWLAAFEEDCKELTTPCKQAACSAIKNIFTIQKALSTFCSIAGGEKELNELFLHRPEVIIKIIDELPKTTSEEERVLILNELCKRSNISVDLAGNYAEAKQCLISHHHSLHQDAHPLEKRIKAFLAKVLKTPEHEAEIKHILCDSRTTATMLTELRQFEPDNMLRVQILQQVCQRFNLAVAIGNEFNSAAQTLTLFSLTQQCSKLYEEYEKKKVQRSHGATPDFSHKTKRFYMVVKSLEANIFPDNEEVYNKLLARATTLNEGAQELL